MLVGSTNSSQIEILTKHIEVNNQFMALCDAHGKDFIKAMKVLEELAQKDSFLTSKLASIKALSEYYENDWLGTGQGRQNMASYFKGKLSNHKSKEKVAEEIEKNRKLIIGYLLQNFKPFGEDISNYEAHRIYSYALDDALKQHSVQPEICLAGATNSFYQSFLEQKLTKKKEEFKTENVELSKKISLLTEQNSSTQSTTASSSSTNLAQTITIKQTRDVVPQLTLGFNFASENEQLNRVENLKRLLNNHGLRNCFTHYNKEASNVPESRLTLKPDVSEENLLKIFSLLKDNDVPIYCADRNQRVVDFQSFSLSLPNQAVLPAHRNVANQRF